MRIADFKAAPRRSTESAVEKAWAATWREMGIYSRHMADAVPGLPDRYIGGGKWVEFKSLYRVRGEFTYGEGLTAEQIRTCSDLTDAGDSVYYCAQLDGWEHGKRYLFVPFRDVRRLLGKGLRYEEFGCSYNNTGDPATAETRKFYSRYLING